MKTHESRALYLGICATLFAGLVLGLVCIRAAHAGSNTATLTVTCTVPARLDPEHILTAGPPAPAPASESTEAPLPPTTGIVVSSDPGVGDAHLLLIPREDGTVLLSVDY